MVNSNQALLMVPVVIPFPIKSVNFFVKHSIGTCFALLLFLDIVSQGFGAVSHETCVEISNGQQCNNSLCINTHTHTRTRMRTHTHTHTLPGWAGTRKVKPIWILLKQETVSGSDINWAICKSAPRSRQITMPAPHRSVFYRPDALPATQPTVSLCIKLNIIHMYSLPRNLHMEHYQKINVTADM